MRRSVSGRASWPRRAIVLTAARGVELPPLAADGRARSARIRARDRRDRSPAAPRNVHGAGATSSATHRMEAILAAALPGGRSRWPASWMTPSCGCAPMSWTSAPGSCGPAGDAEDDARGRRRHPGAHEDHWFVRETIGLLRRTLARLEVSSRTLFALIEGGSCFAGTLLELALAADRSYMLAANDSAGACASPSMTRTSASIRRSAPRRGSRPLPWRVGSTRAASCASRGNRSRRGERWSSAW